MFNNGPNEYKPKDPSSDHSILIGESMENVRCNQDSYDSAQILLK